MKSRMNKKLLQPLKGFRDFLPETMHVRNEVIARFKKVFEKYGFDEMQTPALEYKEVIVGKYGNEAEKLMYTFKDSGGRDVGMKFDQTISLCRAVISNKNLTLPFKVFRIQPVWRADKPQKGRYREFYQCDFDVIGPSTPLSEAEVIATLNDAIASLGFIAYKIKINSRQVLFSVLENSKIPKEKWLDILQTIDKSDKLSEAEIKDELSQKSLTKNQIHNIFSNLSKAEPDDFLKNTLKYVSQMGISRRLVFEPKLARGLDYYTGPIYELVVDEPKVGSIAGGGRYDNLIKDLGGPNMPATGASIGLDRVCDVIEETGLWKELPKDKAKVLVTIFSEKQIDSSLQVANLLRTSDINTELYLNEADKLPKQLKYADKKNFDWAIIIGPNETVNNSVVLKNLKTKKQETMPTAAILSKIK